MSKQVYHEIKAMLCEELEAMSKRGVIRDTEDLEIIDKLTHSIKSVETIIAMNEAYDKGDWSRSRLSDRSGAPRRGSRDADMIAELHELMEHAKDEETRNKFHRFIKDLEER